KHGMQTFNQSLATLFQRRLITLQTAMAYSSNQEELQDMINRGTGVVQAVPAQRIQGRS
ncbi:MAG: type IV pili twitching motility protein PilT, partial [Acidobacteria bacterium]|nr:type IV pili twitching motility protein PilT [Acidobacteriota bacterium]